jgi:hypothetical protein
MRPCQVRWLSRIRPLCGDDCLKLGVDQLLVSQDEFNETVGPG